MSARKITRLRCDAPDCMAMFSCAMERADQTRQMAREQGWAHGIEVPSLVLRGGSYRSFDFCPDHADQVGDLAPRSLPLHAVPEQ